MSLKGINKQYHHGRDPGSQKYNKLNTSKTYSNAILIGSVSFVCFYIIAAIIYPYSFNPLNNFFCDLTPPSFGCENTSNPAFFPSLLTILSMSIVLAFFFFSFANQSSKSLLSKRLIKFFGSISSFCTFCIGIYDLHDQALILAIATGMIPMAIITSTILKNRKRYFPILGLINCSLLTFYVSIFYLEFSEPIWPIMQKITIILSLIWINLIVLKNKSTSSLF